MGTEALPAGAHLLDVWDVGGALCPEECDDEALPQRACGYEF